MKGLFKILNFLTMLGLLFLPHINMKGPWDDTVLVDNSHDDCPFPFIRRGAKYVLLGEKKVFPDKLFGQMLMNVGLKNRWAIR